MAGAPPLLDRVARVALAPAVPQPGESLPGSTPALSAGPLAGRDAPSDKPSAQLRSSLLASHCEGASAEVFAACAGGGVLTAWALHLGASPLVIGLLAALPVAANVLNLPAAWLTHVVGRKRLAVAAIGASRLAYGPLVASSRCLRSVPAAHVRTARPATISSTEIVTSGSPTFSTSRGRL